MLKGLNATPADMARGCEASKTATGLCGWTASERLGGESGSVSVKSATCSFFRTDRLLFRSTAFTKSSNAGNLTFSRGREASIEESPLKTNSDATGGETGILATNRVNETMSQNAALESLAELREEIDRIDGEMHRLLMDRGEIIDRLIAVKARQGGGSAFRPGREADMMRVIAERHHGRLPLETVESIWRVIIATFTYVQSN